MIDRVNPPKGQPGPLAFAGVCIFGVFVIVRGMLTVGVGSEPWWTGVFLLLVVLGGFTFIIGGWLTIQREVDFGPQRIIVRRWLEILTGRPGRIIPVDASTRAAIVLENVRSLRLEHPDVAPVTMTLGDWDLRVIRQLVEVLHGRTIPLDQYWEGLLPARHRLGPEEDPGLPRLGSPRSRHGCWRRPEPGGPIVGFARYSALSTVPSSAWPRLARSDELLELSRLDPPQAADLSPTGGSPKPRG